MGLLKAISDASGGEVHGAERMELGLSLTEMMLEQRALRATVTRLWGRHEHGLEYEHINDLIRFNEAMDRLISEAVGGYSKRKEKERKLLETILTKTPDPSCILDLDCRIIYTNKAMLNLVGKPKAVYDLTKSGLHMHALRSIASRLQITPAGSS